MSTKRFPELEAQLREKYAWMLKNQPKGSDMRLYCERARLEYEEGGQLWEEEFQYLLTVGIVQFRSQFVNFDSAYWGLEGVISRRAPRGLLDARLPEINAVVGTIRPTARWSLSVADLRAKISRIQHEGRMAQIRSMGQTAKIIADANSEISDARMKSWRSQQESSHRIQRATINTIRGVDDFRTSDGRTLAFDQRYERVFEDAAGNLLLSTDQSFDPRRDPNLGTRTWTQVKKVDPFR